MKNKKAFTLAEIMIVLVILGIVAAITIPAVVNRHMEAERRTKLKKAMTVYDTALNKMVIENGIKSDTALINWADSNTKNDCANTSAYFKVSRNLEVNGNETHCKFRAPDGVFWDISDIKKPLVALREQDLNDATAQSDTNRAFYMFGWFDEQGSLRSNDMGKISATDKATLEKLYDFIAGKTKTSMEEVPKPPQIKTFSSPAYNFKPCEGYNYIYEDEEWAYSCVNSGGCDSCIVYGVDENNDITSYFVVGENGNVVEMSSANETTFYASSGKARIFNSNNTEKCEAEGEEAISICTSRGFVCDEEIYNPITHTVLCNK